MSQNNGKVRLLVIEDDNDIAEMLKAYFTRNDFEVITTAWGQDGVQICQQNPPDLVILDIRLPDIDGYEVAARLKSVRRTADIPIIFLTEKKERSDRLKGLEMEVEDYITKPFDIQELRQRAENILQRRKRPPLSNPVTGLPEGALVDEQLEACLKQPGRTVLLIGLDRLDAFRERYSFVAADDLLQASALLLKDICLSHSAGGAFLGQYNPFTFLVTCQSSQVTALHDEILRRLNQSFDYFYSESDRREVDFTQRRLAVNLRMLRVESKTPSLAHLKKDLESLLGQ